MLFAVKEVPIENLMPNKTYFFFSHTIKAQPYNMPLLDKLMDLNIRMIDFEKITRNGERLTEVHGVVLCLWVILNAGVDSEFSSFLCLTKGIGGFGMNSGNLPIVQNTPDLAGFGGLKGCSCSAYLYIFYTLLDLGGITGSSPYTSLGLLKVSMCLTY